MLREIKHSCGHIETYQIANGQFSRMKKFHQARLCKECWKTEAQDKQKFAKADNARSGLPKLTGMPTLIPSAELIRYDFFKFITENVNDLKEKGSEFQMAVDLLRSKQEAAWWHAHKRERFVHLFDVAMDHAAHKMRLKALEPKIQQRLKDLHLVPLSGSIKQIQWGDSIRQHLLLDLIGVELCLEEALHDQEAWAEFMHRLCHDLEPVPKQLEKMSRDLALMDAAGHWIEIRHYSIEEVVRWMHRPESLARMMHMIQGRFFFVLNL
ncbi:hypothetical protein PQO03_20690 [Lentisphaera profundi]|uniref:Uncharacterized protein n=1 Tax=Lentisphaera profundi TaxID=1658616 RepID=A0ABY7VVY1_9BACT|nr:hypothetical protein [Lentisphaera profundi]WDE98237.1 hypothetical protein PQO03_20690 [Lentisphaera profundi]